MQIDVFDMIILACLAYAIFMLATGRGDKLMGQFSPSQKKDMDESYDRGPMNRATLIFCIILLANQLLLMFLAKTYPVISIVSIVICIAALVVYIIYLQKIRKK
ncbi:MAG: hypothetical protein VZR02_07725 [Lachnospiraceae bacterium]|nr:hypothetical protein [Lachnospiraceae bacterium]